VGVDGCKRKDGDFAGELPKEDRMTGSMNGWKEKMCKTYDIYPLEIVEWIVAYYTYTLPNKIGSIAVT
jgi:hypothetical protein